jgi:hypothetical protein
MAMATRKRIGWGALGVLTAGLLVWQLASAAASSGPISWLRS